MTVYKHWKDDEKKFLEQHCDDVEFLPGSKICKRHRLEAGRHASESNYTPTWKRKEQVRSSHTCVYSGCRVTSDTEKLIKPAFAPETVIQQLLNVTLASVSPILLCQIHYCHIYNLLNASLPNPRLSLPSPENSGWLLSSEGLKYMIDWEDPDIVSKVETNIALLIKGCKCKGGCKTNRCGCKKKLVSCGPGCECHECTNLPHTTEITTTAQTTNLSTEERSDDSDSECDDIDGSDDDETDDGAMTGDDTDIETELVTEQFTYCVDIF